MTNKPIKKGRLQTEQKILQALGQVLLEQGFPAVGINAVARQAGCDKVLIYRYFNGLEGLLPGIQIRRLDTFSLLNALVADPESAGLENVTDACLTFGVVGRAICKRPNRHLFWDAAHPTAAGHGAVADAAAQVLSAP